jgi:hypothetical protein
MNSSNKTFLKSKKCMAYLILMACSTGLIIAAVVNGYSPDVVAEMVRTYGMACGAGALALISGQAFIDSKAVAVEPASEPEKIEKK